MKEKPMIIKVWFEELNKGNLHKLKGKTLAGVARFNKAKYLWNETHSTSHFSCIKVAIFREKANGEFFAGAFRGDSFEAFYLTESEAKASFVESGGKIEFWDKMKNS